MRLTSAAVATTSWEGVPTHHRAAALELLNGEQALLAKLLRTSLAKTALWRQGLRADDFIGAGAAAQHVNLALLLSQVLWEAELSSPSRTDEEHSTTRPPEAPQTPKVSKPASCTPRNPEMPSSATRPQTPTKKCSARRQLREAKERDNSIVIQAAWEAKQAALSRSEAAKQQQLQEKVQKLQDRKDDWKDKVAKVRALKAQQEASKLADADRKIELGATRYAQVKQKNQAVAGLVGATSRLRQCIASQRKGSMIEKRKQQYDEKMEKSKAQILEAELVRQKMLEARRVGPPMLREARDRAQLQASRMRRIQENHREELRQQFEPMHVPQATHRPQSAGATRARPGRPQQARPVSAHGLSRHSDDYPEPEAECALTPDAPPPACVPWPAVMQRSGLSSGCAPTALGNANLYAPVQQELHENASAFSASSGSGASCLSTVPTATRTGDIKAGFEQARRASQASMGSASCLSSVPSSVGYSTEFAPAFAALCERFEADEMSELIQECLSKSVSTQPPTAAAAATGPAVDQPLATSPLATSQGKLESVQAQILVAQTAPLVIPVEEFANSKMQGQSSLATVAGSLEEPAFCTMQPQIEQQTEAPASKVSVANIPMDPVTVRREWISMDPAESKRNLVENADEAARSEVRPGTALTGAVDFPEGPALAALPLQVGESDATAAGGACRAVSIGQALTTPQQKTEDVVNPKTRASSTEAAAEFPMGPGHVVSQHEVEEIMHEREQVAPAALPVGVSMNPSCGEAKQNMEESAISVAAAAPAGARIPGMPASLEQMPQAASSAAGLPAGSASTALQPKPEEALPPEWAIAGAAFDELQAWAMTSNDGSDSFSAS